MTCVSRTFDDVARRSTLAVCTALSANRPLVDRPDNHMLNDLVARAFVGARVPVAKEPVGLVRQDDKRPHGLTLIPFEGGRSLTWDVTVVCTTSDSYIDLTVQGPGYVAEMAASRKEAKYATLQTQYDFQPIAVQTLGPVNESAFFSVRIGSASFARERGGQRASVFVSAHFSRHPAV